ncbi:hypothetical protein [Prevotella intermedia]|nr:hypothetical protein PIN17_A1857 [Prevotella intermedia 17]
MSKAGREELENPGIRNNYLERLANAKIIMQSNQVFIAKEEMNDYCVLWL